MYLESAVLSLYFWFLKDDVWFRHLSLNVLEAIYILAVQYPCHMSLSVYCIAFGGSSGNVIQTIQTISNNTNNSIYKDAKFKLKKNIMGANLRFSDSCGI